MSGWLQRRYHVLLFWLAAGLLALSGGWSARSWQVPRHRRSATGASILTGARHTPVEYPPAETASAAWAEPADASLRDASPAEIFGAPPLYFDETRKVYRVAGRAHRSTTTTEAIELLAVVPEPFHLQLTGYVGAPGDYRAMLVHRDGGTWLAREGESSASLGVTLKWFTVEKIPLTHGDRWPVHEIAARAALSVGNTGEEVQLDSRSTKYTGAFLAKFRLTAVRRQVSELREGDTFSDGRVICRVERIQSAPPEVVVFRNASGSDQPEKIIYRPVAAAAGPPKATGSSVQAISNRQTP